MLCILLSSLIFFSVGLVRVLYTNIIIRLFGVFPSYCFFITVMNRHIVYGPIRKILHVIWVSLHSMINLIVFFCFIVEENKTKATWLLSVTARFHCKWYFHSKLCINSYDNIKNRLKFSVSLLYVYPFRKTRFRIIINWLMP